MMSSETPLVPRNGHYPRWTSRRVLAWGAVSTVVVLLALRLISGPQQLHSEERFAAPRGVVPIPGLSCGNPLVLDGLPYVGPPQGWKVVQATVHQRHWDRWIFPHPEIGDVCWEGQLNSTLPKMQSQCDYNLSSIWQAIPRTPDPYAAPASGSCAAKQLTRQGLAHARQLGEFLREAY
eukprot:RCo047267